MTPNARALTLLALLRVDLYNAEPDERARVIADILGLCSEALAAGELAEAEALAYHAGQRLSAHLYMERLAARAEERA